MIAETHDVAPNVFQPKLAGMKRVAAGAFRMGSASGSEAEEPVHSVYLDEFYFDSCLVSNADFSHFVKITGYVTTADIKNSQTSARVKAPSWRTFCTDGRMDHPVVFVSWTDANAYAEWSAKRLPTEAEWEKAARAGAHDQLFSWGDGDPSPQLANWMQSAARDSMPPTAPVTQSAPNAFGIHDMGGNVWQWCSDWFADDYYAISPAANPRGPERGDYRVRRGGAWNVREPFRLRCANRGAMTPDSCWPNIGFRCAWSEFDAHL